MCTYYSVIDYVSGLTSYIMDKDVLKRIIHDRGLNHDDPANFIEADVKQLLLADILYVVYCGADSTASLSISDGSFKQSIGSQTIRDKKQLYNTIMGIYKRYNDPMLAQIEGSQGSIHWVNEFDI